MITGRTRRNVIKEEHLLKGCPICSQAIEDDYREALAEATIMDLRDDFSRWMVPLSNDPDMTLPDAETARLIAEAELAKGVCWREPLTGPIVMTESEQASLQAANIKDFDLI
jgi:hypothetical protein